MSPRQPSPGVQFSACLSRFGPEIVALVRRCLPKIRRAVPCSHELVYEYSHSLVVSFGMSERGYEAVVSLAIFPDLVRLYFDKSLPDPKGLLEGAGSKVRSVVIRAASDLDRGERGADLQALFKAAVRHAGIGAPRAGRARMLFKSGAMAKTSKPTATKPNATRPRRA